MAYDIETWAKVRKDYETGSFSVLKLSKNYSISEPAIKLKIKEENWSKGVLKPLIEEEQQKTTIQMFADAGLPKSVVIEKIKKVLFQTADSTDPKVQNIFDKMLNQYNKMTGGYLERIDITSKDEKVNNEITVEIVRGKDDTNS